MNQALSMDAQLEQTAMSTVDDSVKVQGVFCEFYNHSCQQLVKSRELGHPFFEEEIYIKIVTPGTGRIFKRRATVSDIQKFPQQWQAYKNNVEEPQVGTPITEWPPISGATVDNMKALGIRTVEDLAGMTDTSCQRIMGGLSFREQAREWVEGTKVAESNAKLHRELQSRDETIEKQMELIASLEARMNALDGGKPEETVNAVAEETSEDEALGEEFASGEAEKLAAEKGIPAQLISGTGKDGKITVGDVRKLIG